MSNGLRALTIVGPAASVRAAPTPSAPISITGRLDRLGPAQARFVLALALATCGLIAVPPAFARAGGELEVGTHLNQDGTGTLYVESAGGPWSWEACVPRPSPQPPKCTAAGTGQELTTTAFPGPAQFFVNGDERSGMSPIWHGTVAATSRPTVGGAIRANSYVTPVPGQWAGGWEGGFDQAQLAACSHLAGGRCISLTDYNYPHGCEDGGAVLDPAFTGYYLRVADRLYSPDTGSLLYADGSPYGQPIWEPDAITAVAYLGRIEPAIGRPEASCGPPPLDHGGISRAAVARISCPLGCRAELSLSSGPRRARAVRRIRPTGFGIRRTRTLGLPARLLRRFPGRLLRATLRIDGRRVADRLIRLSEA